MDRNFVADSEGDKEDDDLDKYASSGIDDDSSNGNSQSFYNRCDNDHSDQKYQEEKANFEKIVKYINDKSQDDLEKSLGLGFTITPMRIFVHNLERQLGI